MDEEIDKIEQMEKLEHRTDRTEATEQVDSRRTREKPFSDSRKSAPPRTMDVREVRRPQVSVSSRSRVVVKFD